MSTCYIEKEQVDHIRLTNDTGAALVQYELTVIGGLVVVADEAIAAAAVGSFHVEENINLQIDAADGVSGEVTFGTANANVYWKPSTGEWSDTATESYYKIGTVVTVKDSNGIVLIMKNRDAVLLDEVIAPGEFGFIQYAVDVDRTTLVEVDFGFNFTVIDCFVECRAASGSGTILVSDSSSGAISSALVCAVDTTIGRTTIIDVANAVITDGTLEFIANGAADRGIVSILVKGA